MVKIGLHLKCAHIIHVVPQSLDHISSLQTLAFISPLDFQNQHLLSVLHIQVKNTCTVCIHTHVDKDDYR